MMVGDEMRLSGTCGHVLEIALLAAVPLVMGAALLTGAANAALLMMVVVTLVLVLFFLGYERSQPALRQIMPTLVLAALRGGGAHPVRAHSGLQAAFRDRHHRRRDVGPAQRLHGRCARGAYQ